MPRVREWRRRGHLPRRDGRVSLSADATTRGSIIFQTRACGEDVSGVSTIIEIANGKPRASYAEIEQSNVIPVPRPARAPRLREVRGTTYCNLKHRYTVIVSSDLRAATSVLARASAGHGPSTLLHGRPAPAGSARARPRVPRARGTPKDNPHHTRQPPPAAPCAMTMTGPHTSIHVTSVKPTTPTKRGLKKRHPEVP